MATSFYAIPEEQILFNHWSFSSCVCFIDGHEFLARPMTNRAIICRTLNFSAVWRYVDGDYRWVHINTVQTQEALKDPNIGPALELSLAYRRRAEVFKHYAHAAWDAADDYFKAYPEPLPALPPNVKLPVYNAQVPHDRESFYHLRDALLLAKRTGARSGQGMDVAAQDAALKEHGNAWTELNIYHNPSLSERSFVQSCQHLQEEIGRLREASSELVQALCQFEAWSPLRIQSLLDSPHEGNQPKRPEPPPELTSISLEVLNIWGASLREKMRDWGWQTSYGDYVTDAVERKLREAGEAAYAEVIKQGLSQIKRPENPPEKQDHCPDAPHFNSNGI